jgi:hypothetical protein
MADPWPGIDARFDERIYEAVRGRSGRAGADIPTILESVDSSERWVLTFEELDGGLRRLSDRGLIREVAVGRYVATGSRPAVAYSGISRLQYEAGVAKYRIEFSRDVERVMRSRIMRGLVGLGRLAYRLTGGRFGLAPEWVDLDAVAIAFAVERVLAPFGASTDDVVEGDVLILRVVEGDMRLERAVIAERVRRELSESTTQRRILLRFDDGDEVLTPGRER